MPNSYGQAFLSRPAARGQRVVALSVGAIMMLVTAVLSWSAQNSTPALPAMTPVWLVTMCLAQGFTGLLLGLQASHLRHATLALLAGAYTFVCSVSALQLFGYPGVFSTAGWEHTELLTPWLSLLSRFFFPLWALVAVWQLDRQMNRAVLWAAWLVPSLLAPLFIFCLIHFPQLPPLIVDHRYSDFLLHKALPSNLCLVLVVLALMIGLTRMRTRLHLWLAVVLVAQLCEMTLSLLGKGQFTVGWIGARAMSASASVVLLGALLWDIHDIHRNLQRMNARLHDHATFDQLTGVLMRRPFFDNLAKAMGSRREKGGGCALLMLDVDYFKSFNDAFGHMAGDVCLSTVAQAVRQALPKHGISVGRLGGEEFAVLLTGKSAEKPAAMAEIVRSAVWRQHLPHARNSGQPWVTVSVGWGVPEPDQTAEQLVEVVDQALYRAKRAGRNQVCGADPILNSQVA